MADSVAELHGDPEFQKLAPDAQSIVFKDVSAKDEGFKGLSKPAQKLVMDQVMKGVRPDQRKPLLKDTMAPEPWMPYITDKAKRGLVALPKLGLATVPKDKSDIGFRTSKWIDDVMGIKNLGVPLDEYGKPSKQAEQLGAVAEFVGSGAIPGVGVVSAAEQKLAAAVVEGLGSAVSGESSVMGRDLGEEYAAQFGVDPERAKTIGEFSGSLFGPGLIASAAKGAQKGGAAVSRKTGIDQLGKEKLERAGKAMASDELRTAIEAHAATGKNLEEIVGLQKKVPGFKPTLGQATDAPGIKAIETLIQSKDPKTLAKAAAHEQANLDAMLKFHEQSFPETGISPVEQVRQSHERLAKIRTAEAEATDKQIADLAARSSINEDNVEIGDELRKLRGARADKVKEQASAKYNDVYVTAATQGINADVTDVPILINKVMGSPANAAQVMPRLFHEVEGAIKNYKPEGATKAVVPFAALHSMYKRGNADLLAAVSRGDYQGAHYIQQVVQNLKGKLDVFKGDQYGEVAEKLKAADTFWRTQYQKVFREGAGGRMKQFNRWGDTTNDEDLVRKLFFKPNTAKGMDDFAEIFAGDPRAYGLLERGVTDMFGKAVVRDGEIKPALVESFMRQHAQALEQVPGIKQKLLNVDAANDALLKRRAEIQDLQKQADKSVAAKIAKSDKPEDVINLALEHPDYAKTLLAEATTPENKAALARSFADGIMRQKDPYGFLLKNRKNLEPVLNQLGPEHFDNLKTLSKMKEVLDRIRAPTSTDLVKLQDLGEKFVGTPVKSLLSGVWGVARGYQSRGYFGVNVLGRYIFKVKTEQAEKLLEEAIYDPKLAESLVEATTTTSEQALNKLKNHAYAHGIRVLSVNEDKPDESK